DQVAVEYYASLVPAIRYATQLQGDICITDQVNMPYIFVLFANAMDPHVFQRSVRYRNPGAEFQEVAAFDRYRFSFQDCGESSWILVASNNWDLPSMQLDQYTVSKRFELYTVLTRK